MKTLVSIITLWTRDCIYRPCLCGGPDEQGSSEKAHMTWDASAT